MCGERKTLQNIENCQNIMKLNVVDHATRLSPSKIIKSKQPKVI